MVSRLCIPLSPLLLIFAHALFSEYLGPGENQISKRSNEDGAEVDFYLGFSKVNWKGGEKFFPKFFGTFTNEDGFYMTMEDLMAGKVPFLFWMRWRRRCSW